jgi:hypothetical protein
MFLTVNNTKSVVDISLQDRYKAFGCMFRQWAFLKHLKRSGRGHNPNGIAATKAGECAVACWACPHDGINLPDDWRSVEKAMRQVLVFHSTGETL